MDNYFIKTEYDGTKNLVRVGNDGVVWLIGMGTEEPNYLAWVAEGNTAEEWNPE